VASYLVAPMSNPREAGALRPSSISIRTALFGLLIGSTMLFAPAIGAQAPTPAPAVQGQAPLTLVNGVVEQEDKQTHALSLLTTLTKSDLRLFDNGHEVPIQTFASGVDLSRPSLYGSSCSAIWRFRMMIHPASCAERRSSSSPRWSISTMTISSELRIGATMGTERSMSLSEPASTLPCRGSKLC